jgi:hypothetical protein
MSPFDEKDAAVGEPLGLVDEAVASRDTSFRDGAQAASVRVHGVEPECLVRLPLVPVTLEGDLLAARRPRNVPGAAVLESGQLAHMDAVGRDREDLNVLVDLRLVGDQAVRTPERRV